MSLSLTDHAKFSISRTGLAVHQDLSFDEWAALAPKLNEASRCVGFLIGDWLIYGKKRFAGEDGKSHRRVESKDYDRAVAATGLDRTTLLTYAHVARHVLPSMRNEVLSWEHHKSVASLKPLDQQHWLSIAGQKHKEGSPISTRRLRKSILAGRLLSVAELTADPTERAIVNHIPHVNRLCAWWAHMKKVRWLERATTEQRSALKRDFLRVVKIIEQL